MSVASSKVNEAWNCRRYVARGMADGIDEVELISQRLCFYYPGRALGLVRPVSSWRAMRAYTVLHHNVHETPFEAHTRPNAVPSTQASAWTPTGTSLAHQGPAGALSRCVEGLDGARYLSCGAYRGLADECLVWLYVRGHPPSEGQAHRGPAGRVVDRAGGRARSLLGRWRDAPCAAARRHVYRGEERRDRIQRELRRHVSGRHRVEREDWPRGANRSRHVAHLMGPRLPPAAGLLPAVVEGQAEER